MPTGLVTPRCYAAAFNDCDGGPATREHWVSRALLERIQHDGTGLLVTGLSWSGGPRDSRESELVSKILCRRHNNILHELDDAIVAFYDAYLAGAEGNRVDVTINGNHLERWALKLFVGMLSAGVLLVDGHKVRVGPTRPLLEVIFGVRSFPRPCGFYYVVHGERDEAFKVKVLTPPPGHPLEGIALGITIQFCAFRFLTWFVQHPTDEAPELKYRPAGIDFAALGRISFEWTDGAVSGDIPLDVRVTPK